MEPNSIFEFTSTISTSFVTHWLASSVENSECRAS